MPRTLVKVAQVSKNSFSEKAGIKPGDLLMSVNDVSTRYFDEFKVELLKNKSKTVSIGLDRGGFNKVVEVEVSENGTIGFSLDNNLDLSVEKFSFFESFPAGYNLAITRLDEYISQFVLIFNADNDLASEMGFSYWKHVSLFLGFINSGILASFR